MVDKLPVDEALPELKKMLRETANAVLVAPPGAGKTTRVPLALLEEPWLAGKKLIMLEPRRLAARSAAAYMARSLGEQTGGTVGYRVRLDTKTGPGTRVEVITEGVLTRMLQADPALEGVGAVVFDEFHERSLHGDLGLAMCLQAQSLLREDLRILVMSATLDAGPIADLLGGAPVVTSRGRAYPVETRYGDRAPDLAGDGLERLVAAAVRQALSRDEGDLLVFLPGTGEIRRVQARLRAEGVGQGVEVMPLHGTLPPEEQDAAVSPAKPGRRKVVLSTSIAETSLTVEGVRIVIDSGLMRAPRFSPRTGMSRLETLPVSRASADQRRGRAGRTSPGVCYRLWTEQEDRMLAPSGTPEIREADLAPLALELAAWGTADPAELCWLDPPPAAALAQARELLTRLGALGPAGVITSHGRRMAGIGAHPRLAHMMLQADSLGLGGLACQLAALLGERDPLHGRSANADLRLRLEALRGAPDSGSPGAEGAALARIHREALQLRRQLGLSSPASAGRRELDSIGLLLAYAYPDRIAQSRGGGRFLLSNGRGAVMPDGQWLAGAPYLVAAELDDKGVESRIYLAAALEEGQLDRHFGHMFTVEEDLAWDRGSQAVRGHRRVRLDHLIIRESPLSAPPGEATLQVLLNGIALEGLEILPWSRAAQQLRQRIAFMRRAGGDSWPDVSGQALLDQLPAWLAPHLYGMKSRSDLQRLQLANVLEGMLGWEQRRELDKLAPTHIQVPSGSRIPVDYSDLEAPVLSVRLQELFGLRETPRIGGGRIPLVLHLLSPAHRPVQVTRDLASFWRDAYYEVKKDLKGRYPKHPWPDDPLSAPPTSRAKPRTL